MIRIIKFAALVALVSGCATFSSLTPGSNSDKGVWVAKSTGFMGLMLSNQEVLYCTTGGSTPSCTKAGGDVAPSQTGK